MNSLYWQPKVAATTVIFRCHINTHPPMASMMDTYVEELEKLFKGMAETKGKQKPFIDSLTQCLRPHSQALH
jgi:hypothetical protein